MKGAHSGFAGEKLKPLPKDAGEKTIAWLDKLRNANGSIPTANIRLNMQRIMQTNAAVFRTQDTLEEGLLLISTSKFVDATLPCLHLQV